MPQQNHVIHFLADFQLSKPTAKGERTFSGVAYAGGVITDHSWYSAVAFDLATTTAETPLPLLFNHSGSPIGVIETVSISTQIEIAGRLFADIDATAKDIADKADRGIKWQLSVGIFPESTETLSGMQPGIINGKEFTGEVTLFKKSRIREVSFVTLGADDKTSATVFSSQPKSLQKETPMTLTPDQITALQDENSALKAQVDELTASSKKAAKFARETELKNLFSTLGREYKEESVSVYFQLTDEQFAAVTADLIAQKAEQKPNLPAHLFGTQANDGVAPTGDKSFDFSAVYTDRQKGKN